MPLIDFTPLSRIVSADVDANFALCVLTDTARTITVSHNWNATQYIGDTANANMTLGLTINQGANDDEILALKSSDVAHGITDSAETDTFGAITKLSATAGGLRFRGYSEAAAALSLGGFCTTEPTTKSSTFSADTADGVVRLAGVVKSGTGSAQLGATTNIVTISDGTILNYIFGCDSFFIANSRSVPAGNATGGGLLYSEAGALKWRGSGGTVTILGPA